jgi:Na+(H+)/acetate symporter ActP
MTKHNPALPKLSAQLKSQPFLSFFFHTQTSQRCHPHHPKTGAGRAHPHANQNHQEDSAGKTRARAQTTASPATLTTATAMSLPAVLHRPAIAKDSVIVRLDVMAIGMAIVLDHQDGMTVIDTEMEVTEDAHLDVREAGMRGKRRGRKTSPRIRIRRRRRSPSLLLRPVVKSL